jgi:hypothetical protein
VSQSQSQGAAEKTKRETDVHLRQLAKKVHTPHTHLLFLITSLVRFWAFLGKGSSKTRKTNVSAFPKNSPGECIWGGFFSFTFCCCVG